MIRALMPSDVFAVADLAEQMHAEGRYKNVVFDKKKVIAGILLQLANMILVGFVEEKDKKIVGAVIGFVDQYFFSDEYLLRDRGFFVLPHYRKGKSGAKLLKAYAAAGSKLGVKEILISNSYLDDPNALDLLYKKCGFEKVGSVYKMAIE